MAKLIDGQLFRHMMIGAADAIEQKAEELNSLNVFPVPDGDTGTNMSLTMNAARAQLERLERPTLSRVLEITSSSLLRGARGNSGVILSLIFRGIARGLKDLENADGAHLAAAFCCGADTAYKAVMKPAEGTMLSVMRACGEAAKKAAKKNPDAEAVLVMTLEAGKKALAETTNQNPVLQKAGVVDAGGYGILLILQAMHGAISGKIAQLAVRFMPSPAKPLGHMESADFAQFDAEEITFAYCTEYIAQRVDRNRAPEKLRAALEQIGDCVVVVDDDEIIKVHVHTDHPDRALAEGLKYGPLVDMKIENMLDQHEQQVAAGIAAAIPKKRKIAAAENRYGFVAVAAGKGIVAVLHDLGIDHIVEGGQTMNPSTEDLILAIDQTPAETVFVLPNNKNIIMAARQAVQLSEKNVVVIPSRSVPQGITAMLHFDPEATEGQNEQAMSDALATVRTGQITYAARDSDFDGHAIQKGAFLALEEGKLLTHGQTLQEVVERLAESLCKNDPEFVTIFAGEEADEQDAAAIEAIFARLVPEGEVSIIFGGQPVYSYIISAE